MCRVQVRLAVEEKGMCLAVKTKAVARRIERLHAHGHLTASSACSRPSEAIGSDYKAKVAVWHDRSL